MPTCISRWLLPGLAALPVVPQQPAPPATPPARQPVVGTVVTTDGKPAAGARLELRWREHPELPGVTGIALGDGGVAASTAAADGAGRFRLELPIAGACALRAVAADGASASMPHFPVVAGDAVELVLEPPVVVGGTVHGPDGRPLAHTAVSLQPADTTWTRLAGWRLPEPRGQATTDAEGRFVVPFACSYLRVPRWEPFVVLEFAEPSWLPDATLLRPTAAARELSIRLDAGKLRIGAVLRPDDTPCPAATVQDSIAPWRHASTASDGTYELATGLRRDLVILADGCAPGLLRGTDGGPVRLAPAATVRAVLADAAGAPLAGARVLWSLPLPAGRPLEWTAATDAAGRVAFPRAGGGRTLLGFVERGGVYQLFCRLAPPGDLDLGVLALQPPRAVRGQVLDADGVPLAGVRVTALPEPSLPDEPAWVAFTDRGGRFAFAALPPGQLRLGVDAGADGLGAELLAPGADHATLRLEAGARVSGEVRDGAGEPVPGAWVTLVRAGGVASGFPPGPSPTMTCVCALADDHGRFRFRGLPTGEWQVLANAIRDGQAYGGGGSVQSDGDPIAVAVRPMR